MYGVFGGYTRWAVVFLIIFVLFFLFVPVTGAAVAGAPIAGAPGVAVTSYHAFTESPGYTYFDDESSS